VSVRLFHKGARLVIRRRSSPGAHLWCAVHARPVEWAGILAPALRLLGFEPEPVADGLRFGAGSVRWTRGPAWTTIRLVLPPCSAAKAALLAGGLLKAARYAVPPSAPAAHAP
jgi:hypothetical protein